MDAARALLTSSDSGLKVSGLVGRLTTSPTPPDLQLLACLLTIAPGHSQLVAARRDVARVCTSVLDDSDDVDLVACALLCGAKLLASETGAAEAAQLDGVAIGGMRRVTVSPTTAPASTADFLQTVAAYRRSAFQSVASKDVTSRLLDALCSAALSPSSKPDAVPLLVESVGTVLRAAGQVVGPTPQIAAVFDHYVTRLDYTPLVTIVAPVVASAAAVLPDVAPACSALTVFTGWLADWSVSGEPDVDRGQVVIREARRVIETCLGRLSPETPSVLEPLTAVQAACPAAAQAVKRWCMTSGPVSKSTGRPRPTKAAKTAYGRFANTACRTVGAALRARAIVAGPAVVTEFVATTMKSLGSPVAMADAVVAATAAVPQAPDVVETVVDTCLPPLLAALRDMHRYSEEWQTTFADSWARVCDAAGSSLGSHTGPSVDAVLAHVSVTSPCVAVGFRCLEPLLLRVLVPATGTSPDSVLRVLEHLVGLARLSTRGEDGSGGETGAGPGAGAGSSKPSTVDDIDAVLDVSMAAAALLTTAVEAPAVVAVVRDTPAFLSSCRALVVALTATAATPPEFETDVVCREVQSQLLAALAPVVAVTVGEST